MNRKYRKIENIENAKILLVYPVVELEFVPDIKKIAFMKKTLLSEAIFFLCYHIIHVYVSP